MNHIRSTRVDGGFRPTSLIALFLTATAAAVLVAVVAFGAARGGGTSGGGAGPSAAPSEAPSGTPSPHPSDTPSEQPSDAPARPSPEPTPRPTLEPDPGSDGMPIKVDLDTENNADVYVDIVDRSGFLVGAESGSPADGVSVEPYTLLVENLDEKTLKLKWSDFPIDNALALYIDEADGKLRLVMVQPEPNGPADAMGSDRELILRFSKAVSADDVEAFLQDGLDSLG